MSVSPDITLRVLNRCRDMGFALAGVADALPTQYERELLDWLEAGKHGEMEYLARNVELRLDPREMVEGAKSVLCVADRYGDDEKSTSQQVEKSTGDAIVAGGNPRPPQGRIARYARGDDYHIVMRKRLASLCKELKSEFPTETFRACVDTAPVLERELTQRAGLGAVGKNTLLIERGIGSYLLLGEIITTLPLGGPASRNSDSDPCGSCTRCIDACPTDAITPWSVDATKCISYLTIEHRGMIDEKYHEAMGDWIFGCDVCQEVCPHNQQTSRSRQAATHSAYDAKRDGFDLLAVLNWDEEARRNAFVKSSMKRAKLDMMKRNALIAAGNALVGHASHTDVLARINEVAHDHSESILVRQTAAVVLRRTSNEAESQDSSRDCD